MTLRAVIRPIRWIFYILTEREGRPPRFKACCMVCDAEPEEPFTDPFGAESWAMKHAGKADDQGRHHTAFVMSYEQDATVTPHPDDAPPVDGKPSITLAP